MGKGPSPGVRAKLVAGLMEPMLPLEEGSCRSRGALDGAAGITLGGSGTDLG